VSTVIQKINDELAVLVDRVTCSLVKVGDGNKGGAAATIWHPDGLIVTNAHVASGRRPRVTLMDGRTFEATLLARDKELDLAILTIGARDLPVISLGSSANLRPGQCVMAVGHPWGVGGAATMGIVMGAGPGHLEITWQHDFLPVNLVLRPGNSGGPLVDMEGCLLGINTMMTGHDTGLAIPVDSAREFVRDRLGQIVEPFRKS